MKKILVILLLQMAIAFNVFAQGEGDRIVNPFWKLSSGALSPTVSTWTLTLPATKFTGNILLLASAYLNFNTTVGSTGYGLRDSSGTMQVKNTSGAWANIAGASGSAGGWTDGGALIYPTTSTDSPILANKAALLSTITSDYSGLYFYDDASSVKVMALLDDAGTETTTQIATANMWGEPSGGAILNGTTQNYIHVHNAALDFGTGNGSMEVYFKPDNITDANSFLINKETGGIGYGLEQRTNDLWLRFDDNSTDATAIIGTDVLLANTWYHAIVTLNRAGSATLYLNGVSRGTVVISSTTATVSNAGVYTIGSETGAIENDYAGVISYDKIYNYALTQAEVSRRWNNGQPHLYVEPYATKGASQTELVSPIENRDFSSASNWTNNDFASYDETGDLSVSSTAAGQYARLANTYAPMVIGKKYILTFDATITAGSFTLRDYIASQVFITVTTSGAKTVEFTYTGTGTGGFFLRSQDTTSTGDFDNFTLKALGETFSIANTDWGASGAVCTIGGTKSIANSTAYPIAVSGKYDARKTITANREFTNTAKVGSILKYVKIKNTVAGADTVSLGSTGGGFEVLNAQVVGASSTVIANVAKWFSDSAQQTLFLHATNWATDTLDVVLIYEPIGEKL